MNTIAVKNLGVILRVHDRPQYLERIAAQVKELSRGRVATLIVCADRPSQEVIQEISRISEALPSRVNFVFTESPAKVLSDEGQKWMEPMKHSFAILKHEGCDAGIMWDDDWLFDERALLDMRAHLNFFEYDRLEIEWLQLWDTTETHNTTFPPHWAACLFRVYDNDDFATHFVAHCPERTARSSKCLRLDSKIHHFGYLTEQDREYCWLNYKRGGKIDAHSLALVREPNLAPIS